MWQVKLPEGTGPHLRCKASCEQGHGMVVRAALLSVGFVLNGAGPVASAQQPPSPAAIAAPTLERVHRDWEVRCDAARCAMSVTARSAADEWLATLSIEMVAGDAAAPPLVRMVVPAGVHLASGLFLDIPGREPLEARFVRCSASACAASAALPPEDFAALRRAPRTALRYRPGLTAPSIRFDISLMGLTASWRDAGAALQ